MLGKAVLAERMKVGCAAEAPCESEIGGRAERGLATEKQQGSVDAGGAEDRHHAGIVLVAEVYAADLGADMLGEVGDVEAAFGGGAAPIQESHAGIIAQKESTAADQGG